VTVSSSPPLVVLPAEDDVDAVAARLRRNGHTVRGGFVPDGPFDLTGERIICSGIVATLDDARAAILAAARGAGLLVAVASSAEVEQQFLEDLGRIGEVRRETEETAPTRPALTTEQRQLLDLVAEGASIPAAAAELFISVRTAERRIAQIRTALGVRTTAAAVVAVHGTAR
jgi:DNA-binding NarL/FixJ family response regulator